MKRCILACWLLLCPLVGMAQTCPPGPADPVPRDQVRLAWAAVTTWVQGGAIPAPTQVTYAVYEVVGGVNVKRCTTTGVSAGQLGLSVGVHTWGVTATTPLSTPPNTESPLSMVASKTIAPPVQTPPPPANLTVTGDPTAYEIRTTGGVLVASRIGRVELGTMCTPETQTVAGVKYNRIATRDADFINWPAASPATVKVFARCG